jgi:hypothetical protein
VDHEVVGIETREASVKQTSHGDCRDVLVGYSFHLHLDLELHMEITSGNICYQLYPLLLVA